MYTENASKNNPRGQKHQKVEPKVVMHYENTTSPARCFVGIFWFYVNYYPPESDHKSDAF